ncbi:MAG: hypothetical protein KDC58_00960 [Cyclobacteriaceae bacterium]|nr:hypothetical protein [Cyclobacteriaceae bacterium]
MTVLNQLSSALGQRDEKPNQELAAKIASKKDHSAVQELVDNLNNSSKAIQSDCIKVLYEVGEQAPDLIQQYDRAFLQLLNSKNNRLVWGAMTALDTISSINPKGIYNNLGKILEIADKGSVITKDHTVNILIKLSTHEKYRNETIPLLLEQLKISAINQLPMYAERALPVIRSSDMKIFAEVLSDRLNDIEKESKRKRMEKVIRKLT